MNADDERFCHYCFTQKGNLYALHDWRKTGLLAHFCWEHYVVVKEFQDVQKRQFLRYFKDLDIDIHEK
ncbi:hypothetical protein NLX67_21265 [Domibacillus sp. A3M-37]|uniref:hypothetical protein n=1 Tax=Domibacillus sp. A3M-37 TaxID=2962037 RepID=UPI0020B870D6|nr:hypothetical protein [Domibacillus sp. A3M-37]MCP3764853.1 hypothetical protein [Domibacillus sp. A3M-37]